MPRSERPPSSICPAATLPGRAPLAITSRFFERPAPTVGPSLIGCGFFANGVGGVIVECEAYEPDDPASHTFRGRTKRNAAMFGSPGTLYVYLSYGLHRCANLVCLPGHAVLLRAIEPTSGIEDMIVRRAVENRRLLCSGPGRLTQALGIDLSMDGMSATAPPFHMTWPEGQVDVSSGVRVGVTRATERPWRFGLAGSAFRSRPFPN
jgi:DNA-3-methyladenine glycosylase